MRVYRLTPSSAAELAWSQVRVPIILVLFIAVVVPFIGANGHWISSVYSAVALLAVCCCTGWWRFRSVRRLWESYELSLGGEVLIIRQKPSTHIEIPRSTVLQIRDVPGRGMLVMSSVERRFWYVIPILLPDYSEIRAEVRTWGPVVAISRKQVQFAAWRSIAMRVVGMAAFLTSFLSSDPPLSVSVAAGLDVVLVWNMISIIRTGTQRSRRLAFITLLPLITMNYHAWLLWNSAW